MTGKKVSGVGCQGTDGRGHLNSEGGMRPLAHRGLGLRPGGKSEKQQ